MSSQPQKGPLDDILLYGMGFILVIIAIYFSWPVVNEFYLTIKLWQMELIAKIVPTEHNLALLHKLHTTQAFNWTIDEKMELGYTVNNYFLPFTIIIFWAILTFTKDKLYQVLKYSKIYNKESFLEQEKKLWRYLEPVAHKQLLFNDVAGWESAKKPQHIAVEYNLLNNKNDTESLNEEKALKYFALQLGELYTGIDSLKTYQKALVGCFAEFKFGNKHDAEYALMDIAESFGKDANGKISFDSGLSLYEKHKDNKELLKYMAGHSYKTTAIARIFNESKGRGIMISRYCLWLKEYDRTLFYILNAMGRQVSWTECGGIFDHYQHEVALGRPLTKIFVKEAVNGLKEELKNVKISDIK